MTTRILRTALFTSLAWTALTIIPSTAFAVGPGSLPDPPDPPVTPTAGTPARPPVTSPVDPPTSVPSLPPITAPTPPSSPGGGSHPTLPAPADVTACVDAGGNLNVAWCAVPGATKYSVEVEASYNLGTACGDATEEFSFGTNGTSIEVPLAAFAFDFGSGLVDACSLSVQVKGLNPPQPQHSQNNPFTAADQNPIDPTVVTCLDLDTALDPSCP